jgi:dipeptidase D
MSKEIENLPETSTNLASVKMPDNCTLIVSTSQRSSVESKKHEIKDRVEAIFALAGADKITHSDGYPGWKPNLQSKIKKIVVKHFTNSSKRRQPSVLFMQDWNVVCFMKKIRNWI